MNDGQFDRILDTINNAAFWIVVLCVIVAIATYPIWGKHVK